ncbi:alpha/beta fold hydrolase [Paraburkholderia phymatum]|uniref:Alpha/beta fold hydrolase n=1 Tax=Paraburkholderia phymatum TaxID=148447 RepID=A0ACC6UC90_9BURK
MLNTPQKLLLPLVIAGALLSAATAQAAPDPDLAGKNIVLVHGAWANGSSWDKVIPLLEAKGLHVTSVQNPLTSLGDDVSAATRAIDRQNGPVVLVGHSWAGSVITQAGNNDKVKALVYVAAFAPDNGQSANDIQNGLPAPSWAAEVHKDAAGFLTLSDKAMAEDFAPDVSPAQVRLLAATQGPWYSGCVAEKIGHAAWHDKPSWYVVPTKDVIVPPDFQMRLAKQIGATTVKVEASHVPMLSKPEKVAAAIISAARQAK